MSHLPPWENEGDENTQRREESVMEGFEGGVNRPLLTIMKAAVGCNERRWCCFYKEQKKKQEDEEKNWLMEVLMKLWQTNYPMVSVIKTYL